MPRVSTRRLDKNIEQEIVANLDWLVSQLKSEEQANLFLQFVLTREERLMLAKRLAVLFLIHKGYHYSDIAEALKITPATISKFRSVFDVSSAEARTVLQKLDEREKSKRAGEKIENILEEIGLMLSAKRDMRARAELTRRAFSK